MNNSNLEEGLDPIQLGNITQKPRSFWVVGVPKNIYPPSVPEEPGKYIKTFKENIQSNTQIDAIKVFNCRIFSKTLERVSPKIEVAKVGLKNIILKPSNINEKISSKIDVDRVGLKNIIIAPSSVIEKLQGKIEVSKIGLKNLLIKNIGQEKLISSTSIEKIFIRKYEI